MQAELEGRRHAWWVGALALAALLWCAPGLDRYLTNADHGYQLSMARLLVLGAVPVVDFLFHYGPLVAITSGLALQLSGSLLGETLVCASSYALSLACLGRTARERVGRLAGWLAPAAGLILLARFYKWYFWLFPALALYWLHRLVPRGDAPSETQVRDWLIAGLIAGGCGLYRLDLGVVLLIAFGVATAVSEWRSERPVVSTLKDAAALLLGMSLPLGAWLAVLALWAGPSALGLWFQSTLDGGSGVVSGWSRAAPLIDGAPLLSAKVGLRVGQALVPMIHVFGLVVGVATGLLRRGGDPNARFMLTTAVLGIGMLPQAFYRADFQHFLQALPPVIVGVPLAVAWVIRATRGAAPAARIVSRTALVAALALVGIASIGLSKKGAIDLSPVSPNPVTRYAELLRGPGADSRNAVGRVSAAIQARSTAGDPILIIPRVPQLYFFAERPMSGVLNSYVHDILDGPEWRRFNLAHVEAHPPELVAAYRSFLDADAADTLEFQESQPELHALLRSAYTRVDYEDEDWVLLRRVELHDGDAR